MSLPITAITKNNEPRIDSRLIAEGLDIEHKYFIRLIARYTKQLNRLGVLRFENPKPIKGSQGGRPVKFTLLNEDQCYFVITLSNNTEQTVKLKLHLVLAFKSARDSLEAKGNYLPCYHQCHDAISTLIKQSGSTTAESIHHMNVEKMINKAFGIPAGSRDQLPAPVRAAVSMAEHIAGTQYQRATDHKEAYKSAKAAVESCAASVIDSLPALSYSSVN
jgi:phage regulator Rha-like protein